eukprot:scaffold314481_cov22-Tisochrysis_lutea.AAC.2
MPSLAPPLGLQATPQQACSVLLPAAGNEGYGCGTEHRAGQRVQSYGVERRACRYQLDRAYRHQTGSCGLGHGASNSIP